MVIENMTAPPGPAGSPPGRRASRRSVLRASPHAVWAVVVVVPFGAYLAWLSQTTLPPGQCTGLGWGCSVAGWDAVGLAAIIYGVPLAALWFAGHLLIALIRRRRRSPAPALPVPWLRVDRRRRAPGQFGGAIARSHHCSSREPCRPAASTR